jgi:hypothetical protein
MNNLATVSTTAADIGTAIFPAPVPQSRLQKVEEGLIFITNHFDPTEPLLPRKISTHATGGKQITVYSFEEALSWFNAADFFDCRISAYPIYRDEYVRRTGILFVPGLLLIDLDREHFTNDEFEAAAAKTISNFKEILAARPTWLWTGGGYHFILPQSVIEPLEKIEDFNQEPEPSRKFLQFEEWLMTDGKADQNHNRTMSFKNCMLKIPGSLNFGACQRNDKDEIIGIPPEAEVGVIQRWDGNRPSVNHLLSHCYIWIQAKAIKDIQRRRKAEQTASKYRNHNNNDRWSEDREKENRRTFRWIEKLLDKPIDGQRYYCVWRVLVPYLINVRRLSRQEASDIIYNWLDKCNSVKRLSFSPKQKIGYCFDHVGDYWPISRADLEQDNKLLFQLLKNEMIVY